MTAVLPLLNAHSNLKDCATVRPPHGRTHWLRRLLVNQTGKLGRSAVRGVYALAYRIGRWRSKPEFSESSQSISRKIYQDRVRRKSRWRARRSYVPNPETHNPQTKALRAA